MNAPSRRQCLARLLLAMLLGIVALDFSVQRVSHVLAEPDPLRTAWRRAHDAGSYHFSATIHQTLAPRSTAANAGQTGVAYTMGVEGDVDGPYRSRARLSPLNESGTPRAFSKPAEIVVWGDQVYARQTGEAWQLADANPAAIASAQTDYLAFLNAARDVRELGAEQIDGVMYRRYGFRIDGPAYARYVVEQMARANSDPTVQTDVIVPARLRSAKGTGELWVSEADGLPYRQIVEMHFPDMDPAYVLDARLEIEFNSFGQPLSVPIVKPVAGEIGGLGIGDWGLGNWEIGYSEYPISNTQSPVSTTHYPDYLATLLVVLTFLVVWKLRRRQLIYAAVVTLVVISLVTTPILRSFNPRLRRVEAAPIAEILGDQPSDLGHPPSAQYPISNTQYPTSNSTTTTDTDGDGLTDEMETLLGTFPDEEDSDLDGLTDKEEADGFEFDGDTYYTNPMWPDTNHDGLGDWAELTFPNTTTLKLDLDEDGLPNVFDRDNDDDGVMDAIDISPWSHSGTYSKADPFYFEVERYGDEPAVPVYVTLQLRPVISEHLRYIGGKFDWPIDFTGQIKDQDGSRDDMSLIPMLEISAAQDARRRYSMPPEGDNQLDKYNVSADYETHKLYVPLSPLRDNGDVVGFHSKVYYPADTDTWANRIGNRRFIGGDARLVWLLTYKNDAGENSVIVQYYEDFYLTGFTVEEEHGLDIALLYDRTTPVVDDFVDPTYLLQTLVPLEQTFMQGGDPTLDTLTTTLQSTWGYTTVEVLRRSYTHTDEALATTAQTTTQQILNSFPVITDGLTVPLVYLYEQSSNSFSLDHAADGERVVSGDLRFNMGDALGPIVERGMKLQWYNTETHAQLGSEAIVGVVNRYNDEWNTTEDLETQAFIKFWLASWTGGHEQIIYIGDVKVPHYAVQVTETAKELEDAGQGWDAIKSVAKCYKTDKDPPKWDGKDLGLTLSVIAVKILFKCTGYGEIRVPAGEWIGHPSLANWSFTLDEAVDFGVQVHEVYSKFSKIKNIQGGLKGLFGPVQQTRYSKVLGYVGLIVEVGIIWYSFFAATSDMDRSSPQYKFALAYTIAQTIIATALFLLAMTGIGLIIVAVFALVSLFLSLFGIDLKNELALWLAQLFYHIDVLTEIPDEGVKFGSIDFDIKWSDTSGVAAGNELVYTLPVTSTIWNTKHGSKTDVRDSTYKVELRAGTWSPADQTVSREGSYECDIKSENVVVDWAPDWTRHTETCVQKPQVHIAFAKAEPDQMLSLDYVSKYKLFYQECDPFCERKETTGSGSNTLDTSYFDVLPATLTQLWNWDDDIGPMFDQTWNDDRDGDGLRDESWTAPDNWDSDGDTLSDYYERTAAGRPVPIRLNPLSADTDGDGLRDDVELDFGSDPVKRDTDGDGLSDKSEYDGWMMTLETDAGSLTTRAWPDPNRADGDGDGLNDLEEYRRRSNPNGYTVNLSLRQTAQPVIDSGWPPVVKSGDYLTFTADYMHSAPLSLTQVAFTSTLPTQLVDTGHAERGTGGLSTPALQGVLPHWWTVDQTVTADQGFVVTLTGQVSPSYSGSGLVTHTVDAAGLYAGAPISGTSHIYALIDNDDPTCAVGAPEGGSFIQGSSLVFGGDASDPTSWVEHVERRVYRTGYDTGWELVTNTTSWASDWTIPGPTAGDGAYTATCRATDVMEHQAQGSGITLTVDNTAPTSTIESPVSGQTLSATILYDARGGVPGAVITVTGSAGDNASGADRVSGVRDVAFSADDGSSFQAVAGVTPTIVLGDGRTVTWTHPWQLSSWNFEGCYTLTVQASDFMPNVQTPPPGITVTVDNTPPASDFGMDLGVNLDAAFISGSLVITGHSYDVPTHHWGHFEGDYCRAGVQDVQVQVWRDQFGATFEHYTPTLVADWTTVDTIGAVGAYTSPFTTTWTPAQDGRYRLYVRSTDGAANLETVTTTQDLIRYAGGGNLIDETELVYWADVTPPTVTLDAPTHGSIVSNPVVVISGTTQDAPDGLGLDPPSGAVQVSLDGGSTWQPYTATVVEQTDLLAWNWLYYFEPPADGVYTATARARDVLGNLGTVATPITFEVDATGPIAWITNLRSGDVVSDATGSGEFIVRGVAHSTGFNVNGVQIEVDNDGWVSATQAPTWNTWVYTWTLPFGGGQHRLWTTSWDDAGVPNWQTLTQTQESAVTVTVDTGDPIIALDYPVGWSGVVTGSTWVFSGTVDDLETSVQSVHVQTDTAAPWHAADTTLITQPMTTTQWRYEWDVPELDWVTRTVSVRAVDAAGNATTTLFTPSPALTPSLYVDNVPPINPITVTTNLTAGFWFTDNSTAPQVNWTGAYDGGGIKGYDVRWDPDPNWGWTTVNSSTLLGFSGPEHYLHLRSVDLAGNRAVETLAGPFRYDDAGTPSVAVVDGEIELDQQEWLVTGEWMGEDPRGDQGPQTFYLTWDDENLYVGWEGGAWDGGGDLFLYFDTDQTLDHTGVTVTWDYQGYGTHTLPPANLHTLEPAFYADRLLYVEDSDTWGLKRNTSGTLGGWLTRTASATTTVAYDGGDTEIRLLLEDLGITQTWSQLKVLAVAQEEMSRTLWAAFPNVNPLEGGLTAYYDLSIGPGATPNEGLEEKLAAGLDLSGQAWPDGYVARGGAVTYTLRWHNGSQQALWTGAYLTVTLPGDLTGPAFDGQWQIHDDLGGGVHRFWLADPDASYDLPAGASGVITATGEVANDAPSGLLSVTGTLAAAMPGAPDISPDDNTATPAVKIDATPPTASFMTGAYVGPNATILGVAEDDRSGVAMVELDRSDGNGFWVVSGTVVWSGGGVGGSDGAVRTLHVRATDAMGNVGSPASLQVTLDAVAPAVAIVSPSQGEVIPFGGDVTISGTVSDARSGVAWAQLRIDSGAGVEWLPTQLGNGVWSYNWMNPITGTYTLTVRAADNVGNVATSVVVRVAIGPDTLGPDLTLSEPQADALLGGASVTVRGTASDFSGVDWIQVSTNNGASWADASGTSNWSYVWTLPAEDGVGHTLIARGQDMLGNPAQTGGRAVTVDTVAPNSIIGNLTDGQILSGTTYIITGTASDGHGVAQVEVSTDNSASWVATSGTTTWSYTWTLPAGGSYTVTARATDLAGNQASGQSVTVQVIQGYRIFLPLVLRNN